MNRKQRRIQKRRVRRVGIVVASVAMLAATAGVGGAAFAGGGGNGGCGAGGCGFGVIPGIYNLNVQNQNEVCYLNGQFAKTLTFKSAHYEVSGACVLP